MKSRDRQLDGNNRFEVCASPCFSRQKTLKSGRKIGFTVEIGGITAEIFSKCHEPFLKSLRKKYEKFLSKNVPDVRLEIFSGKSGTASTKVTIDSSSGFYYITCRKICGRINYRTGTGKIYCSEKNPYTFDSFLRVLWTLYLARQSGMLVHAASVACRNSGLVFCGKSGSGKSTLAKAVMDRSTVNVLGDEIALLKRVRGKWWVFGTPFNGEHDAGMQSKKPLERIFFLEKSQYTGRNQVKSRSVNDFLRHVLFFCRDKNMVKKIFDLAADISAGIPFGCLCWPVKSSIARWISARA